MTEKIIKQIEELARKTELKPEEKTKMDSRHVPLQTIEQAYDYIKQARRLTDVDYQESFTQQYNNVIQNFRWDSSLDINRKAAHEFYVNGTPIHESVKNQLIDSLANRKVRSEYAASLIRADLTEFCQKVEQEIRSDLKRMGFVFECGAKAKGKTEWDGYESILHDWEYIESFPALPDYLIDARLRLLNSVYHFVKPSVKTQQETQTEEAE